MRFKVSLLLVLLVVSASAHERTDIGFFLGTSYYVGDYNPRTQFYQPSPSGGVLLKQNLSNLYSVRVSAATGGVQGSHNQNTFYLPGETNPFSKQFYKAEVAIEIGFLEFDTRQRRRHNFSPYVTLGFGVFYISDFNTHIPFGVGVKYTPYDRWAFGVEWRIHKTFYDEIDDYVNISQSPRSIIHNNDWIGFAGIFVSYRLVRRGAVCPAYE